MSSKSEVFIRILAVLQRKTLIETKNRTLKYLNDVIRLCDQWKMLQCWQRKGICPLFSFPPQGIWQIKSPHTREFAIQGKKNANARGSAEGGGGLGAAGIDWYITSRNVGCF